MPLKGIFSSLSPLGKLLVFVGVLLLSTSAITILGFVSVKWIWGISLFSQPDYIDNFSNPFVVSILKYLQVVSQAGVMIVPPMLAIFLFSEKEKDYLSLARFPKIISLLLVAVVIIAANPLINYLALLNEHMSLPSFLHGLEDWMKQYEDKAGKLTDVFLKMPQVKDLLINLFMIALIPAIGEEFLFRGVFQNLFSDLLRNKHAAIFVTAALFSAIHFQFYGFIPRMLLGVYFGYLLLWSKSIWLPVAAHFVNNASAVIFSWFAQRNNLSFNPDTIGTGSDEWKMVMVSVLCVSLFSLLIKKHEIKIVASDKF